MEKKREKEIKKLNKDYPNVPTEIFDIEASPEMAEMYSEMFGY